MVIKVIGYRKNSVILQDEEDNLYEYRCADARERFPFGVRVSGEILKMAEKENGGEKSARQTDGPPERRQQTVEAPDEWEQPEIEETEDESERAVLDNCVIGYDRDRVIIEDEEGNQYVLSCEDPENFFPLGTCADYETLQMARRVEEMA